MSALRVYWPAELSVCRPDDAEVSVAGSDGPVILSFPSRGSFSGSQYLRLAGGGAMVPNLPIDRARLLHENRCCRQCGHGGTIPQEELALAVANERMPVPGAARLLGFECGRCGHSWGV